MTHTKQIIIVRRDLQMKPGKLAAQVAHASMGAILSEMIDTRVDERMLQLTKGCPLTHWLENSFTKIVLRCDSEAELLEYQRIARANHMTECLITDNGLTVFDGVPTVTCLAIGPDWDVRVSEHFGHLKLL